MCIRILVARIQPLMKPLHLASGPIRGVCGGMSPRYILDLWPSEMVFWVFGIYNLEATVGQLLPSPATTLLKPLILADLI